jgi:hypothetical protein
MYKLFSYLLLTFLPRCSTGTELRWIRWTFDRRFLSSDDHFLDEFIRGVALKQHGLSKLASFRTGHSSMSTKAVACHDLECPISYQTQFTLAVIIIAVRIDLDVMRKL